jgi:hypothetical protein
MNDYARARGVALQENTDAEALAGNNIRKRRPLAPLSAREQEIIGRRRELVLQHMPELVPEIKALVDAGMIDGWRNVTRIEVFETGEVV